MRNKRKTLTQFVAGFPSQRAAAREIGVPPETLCRWLHRTTAPEGLSVKRLAELGVLVDGAGRITI